MDPHFRFVCQQLYPVIREHFLNHTYKSHSHSTMSESTAEQTEVNFDELILVQACCCMVQGLYCPSFAKCFGCTMKGESLCIGFDATMCKMVDSSVSENEECCVLSNQNCVCKKPQTVRSTKLSCCCCVLLLYAKTLSLVHFLKNASPSACPVRY